MFSIFSCLYFGLSDTSPDHNPSLRQHRQHLPQHAVSDVDNYNMTHEVYSRGYQAPDGVCASDVGDRCNDILNRPADPGAGTSSSESGGKSNKQIRSRSPHRSTGAVCHPCNSGSIINIKPTSSPKRKQASAGWKPTLSSPCDNFDDEQRPQPTLCRPISPTCVDIFPTERPCDYSYDLKNRQPPGAPPQPCPPCPEVYGERPRDTGVGSIDDSPFRCVREQNLTTFPQRPGRTETAYTPEPRLSVCG